MLARRAFIPGSELELRRSRPASGCRRPCRPLRSSRGHVGSTRPAGSRHRGHRLCDRCRLPGQSLLVPGRTRSPLRHRLSARLAGARHRRRARKRCRPMAAIIRCRCHRVPCWSCSSLFALGCSCGIIGSVACAGRQSPGPRFPMFPSPSRTSARSFRVNVPVSGNQCWDAPQPCAPGRGPDAPPLSDRKFLLWEFIEPEAAASTPAAK